MSTKPKKTRLVSTMDIDGIQEHGDGYGRSTTSSSEDSDSDPKVSGTQDTSSEPQHDEDEIICSDGKLIGSGVASGEVVDVDQAVDVEQIINSKETVAVDQSNEIDNTPEFEESGVQIDQDDELEDSEIATGTEQHIEQPSLRKTQKPRHKPMNKQQQEMRIIEINATLRSHGVKIDNLSQRPSKLPKKATVSSNATQDGSKSNSNPVAESS